MGSSYRYPCPLFVKYNPDPWSHSAPPPPFGRWFLHLKEYEELGIHLWFAIRQRMCTVRIYFSSSEGIRSTRYTFVVRHPTMYVYSAHILRTYYHGTAVHSRMNQLKRFFQALYLVICVWGNVTEFCCGCRVILLCSWHIEWKSSFCTSVRLSQ